MKLPSTLYHPGSQLKTNPRFCRISCASLFLITSTVCLSAGWVELSLSDSGNVSALEVKDGRLFIEEANVSNALSTEDLIHWKAPVEVTMASNTNPGTYENRGGGYYQTSAATGYTNWTSGEFTFNWTKVTAKRLIRWLYQEDFSCESPVISLLLVHQDSESGGESIGDPIENASVMRYGEYVYCTLYGSWYSDSSASGSTVAKAIIYRFRDGDNSVVKIEKILPEYCPQIGSNTQRFYVFDYVSNPFYLDTDGTVKEMTLSDNLAVYDGIFNNPLIADDGNNTIILNNRAYSNDDGQTWNEYNTPLPADYISYADGVFTYTGSPNETNGLTGPIRARSTDQGKTWNQVGFHEALSNYELEAVWHSESNSTELNLVIQGDGTENFSMPNQQVLDSGVFNGNFVVLTKFMGGPDPDQRSLWVYATEQSPLTTVSDTQGRMIDDGCWEFEFKDRPNIPFFMKVDAQNKSAFQLFASTGRARNAIYGISEVSSYPWVFNDDLDWHVFYKADDTVPAAYLWSPYRDWLYTTAEWYPFLWSFKNQTWVWIDAGEGHTHRWFLYNADGVWE